MASFKDPSFQDRAASARKARQKALDCLKAKPPVDAAVMAERRDAWDVKEKALSAERTAKAEQQAKARADQSAQKAAKAAQAQEAAALKAARLKPASAADMKAARDARYAARQSRK